MNDNQLFTAVRSALVARLAARGLVGWDVIRNYAPDHQGASSSPVVYMHKTGEHRHGTAQALDVWDDGAGVMRHTESQQCETTLQLDILATETTDPDALTPSDAASIVCSIMQSEEVIDELQAAGAGVLRITDVRNPYDVNDRDQYAANPSFDLILTHRRVWQSTAPVAVEIDVNVNRV